MVWPFFVSVRKRSTIRVGSMENSIDSFRCSSFSGDNRADNLREEDPPSKRIFSLFFFFWNNESNREMDASRISSISRLYISSMIRKKKRRRKKSHGPLGILKIHSKNSAHKIRTRADSPIESSRLRKIKPSPSLRCDNDTKTRTKDQYILYSNINNHMHRRISKFNRSKFYNITEISPQSLEDRV